MADSVFTPAQWEAARMLVARLHCESQQRPFEYSDLGISWLNVDDKVCAVTDRGLEIRSSDLLYAAVILLWSLLVEQSLILDEDGQAEAIARLGMGIAAVEPTGP